MDELIKKLIIRVWNDTRQAGIPCGQTRMTKLLYLIEWEYFAWTRQRLTSLNWIFWHYGPWASDLSNVLEKEFAAPQEELKYRQFRKVHWSFPEFEYVDTKLKPVDLEGIVGRVIETFGSLPTEEIIEYVYFNTEPMKNAVRGEPLNFESTQKPISPFNAFGALKPDVRKAIRERLRKATDMKAKEVQEISGEVPPDAYKFFWMDDTCGEIDLTQGSVEIKNDDKPRIAREG